MIRRIAIPLALLLPSIAYAGSERTFSPLVRGLVPGGDPQGAAPTSRGTIALAPESKELASPPAPYLWSLVVRDGKIYGGSGDGGEIWIVPEDGSAAKLFYDAVELQAQALAVRKGELVAALNPGARVVRIGADGKAETLFKAPTESFAWAMLADPKDGALHVAVGSPGRVYRVDPGQGTPPKVELESGDGAVRALAFAKDGKLLAGTDGRGLVERVDGEGKRFVLFDAPRREISSISVAPDGMIWFAAIGQEEAETPAASAPAAAPTAFDPKKGPAGQLYRMRPDGFAELIWTAPGPSITSVLARRDGVFVATGDPGAVWRVDADGTSRKLLDPSAGQVTSLVAASDDVLVGTANPSKVFRLSTARKNAGKFEASALDAGGFARWGTLRWDSSNASDAKLEVATRSGNTATPDASWSAWSAPIPSSGAAVASPSARYLQWRVSMTAGAKSPDPELTQVEAIFRVENRAPKVDAIAVEEPGVTLAPKADALLPGYAMPPEQKPTAVRHELPSKRGYMRGWRAAHWAASDLDGDDLVFDVFLRGLGETSWIPIASGIPETYSTWDATSFPDGRYELRVVARDDAANGAGSAASGERIVGPFESDTTPPRVEGLAATREGGKLAIRFTATDAGVIAKAEVAIDGGEWTLLAPADGLADSPSEKFDARITAPGGEHLVVVRVQDRSGNQSSAKTALK